MKLALFIALALALIVVYFAFIRPYLKTLPTFAELYDRERSAWDAFKAWLIGRRTIIIGIWGELVAFLPDFLQQAAGFDLKTLLGLPDSWAAYVTALIPVLMAIFRARV